ncbi:GTP cyclohydrolase II [Flexibacterium corallicola]|uniref:GTP cyclohydrolase II n=1 Tax=Flexibacterium corallicola TaxID=3037259 RepID=UPI00286F4F5B|nr:GTP cyclohydrolase II [Pseudovibrio sp. M1P-2-3]
MTEDKKREPHIRLTTHPGTGATSPFPIDWGNSDPLLRGPVIASVSQPSERNAIGVHGGTYSLYRALAVSAGSLDPMQKPDLKNTSPTVSIGPYTQWYDPDRIISLDPFGHIVADVYGDLIESGVDIRPTVAVTKAHLNLEEVHRAVEEKRLSIDGEILTEGGEVVVTKIAADPVWYLPGVAKRFGIGQRHLRRVLFEQTGGMYPDLVTRPDLQVFLPPIGGLTAYVFGDPEDLAKSETKITCRVHDECNGSDVFGSDICTCRPYLLHGVEEAIKSAQEGGAGLIIYNRKEGRALGEVTKFLVYNARKRQDGGDRASTYFERTECVAGVQDARFQELMPDILHWLGITHINRFISMSDMKYDAITKSGISVGERVPLPEHMIPADAQVEMRAKQAAGYFSLQEVPDKDTLNETVGRPVNDY